MKKTLERHPEARINRDKPIPFFFDGRSYLGYEGDTLASALLANGVDVVARSFKFHRPRGVFGAGKEESNALVQLESGAFTEPNVRATLAPIYPDMRAYGQNAWPSVKYDCFGVLGILKRYLPASFYYKTFMWPSWHFWEGLVRRIAGLGKVPEKAGPETYLKQNVHADVVVVGAGRAGINAALDAAIDPDCRVLIIDEQEELGGSLLSSTLENDRSWLCDVVAKLEVAQNISVLTRTTVNGYYDNNVLAALERVSNHLAPLSVSGPREKLWRIFATRVVLATGAIERPMVFPNNDRPGIMLASAFREYSSRYGLILAEWPVFYANNDSAWHTALELDAIGLSVQAIVDVRSSVSADLQGEARERGIDFYLGTAIVDTIGRRKLRKIKLGKLIDGDQGIHDEAHYLSCDLLAISGGWSPTVHLFSQSGGSLDYRESDACFLPGQATQAVAVVGRANGEFSRPLKTQAYWLTPGVSPENQWIDLQYDVTASDIQLAARENFVSVEHVKRYTTNGMAVDQGKTSNVNGLGVLAQALGKQVPDVGTTRFRPPYHPATIGAYAGVEQGSLYRPFQRLPLHEAHVVAGAYFEDYGSWQRPAYYPLYGEDEQAALAREAQAVREAVGLLDYSPLGKIEVHGPDAREFLNRVYINNIKTLKLGAARYGLMLNEAGIVIDDGILVCLAEDHFLVHTTSGGASTIHQHMEEWLQCEWLDLKVLVNNCTSQWSTLMLSGPRARQVLEKLPGDIDLSRDAFAHMHFRQGVLLGQSCRILRASFTGEVSFEISVPARQGIALWNALLEAGEPEGIIPFGIESLMLLRTEKGYLHVGADTDGNTMPQDLGWANAIARKPDDFIGRRTLELEVGRDLARFQFTGIELLDHCAHIESGAHVLTADGEGTAGYVTSAFRSPKLGRTVALGIVTNAQSRVGENVELFHDGKRQSARLVKPCAYDPSGEALNG